MKLAHGSIGAGMVQRCFLWQRLVTCFSAATGVIVQSAKEDENAKALAFHTNRTNLSNGKKSR